MAEWISPTAGAAVSGTVTWSAFASDDVAVARVEFFVGTTKIGEDTSAPYSVEWDTTARDDGTVTLEVVATDGVGRQGTDSITVEIRNDGVPPALDLRQPSAGATVGVQFTVTAEITRRGEDFTWVLDDGRKLWARVYDQVGDLVVEDYFTSDGSDAGVEPLDDVDFVASRDFDLESFRGELPLDQFTLVLEGTVVVNGEEVPLRVESEFDVTLDTNLPPALVVFAPISEQAGVGKPTFGNTLSIVGRVTDDAPPIHSVEVRMVCTACGTGGAPQNKLLLYFDADDLFSTGIIPLDGTPFVGHGDSWELRVVAIDGADTTLRTIIKIPVNVDRTADTGNLEGSWGTPVTEPPTTTIDPSAATWTYTFNAPLANPVEVVAAVNTREDGTQETQEVVKTTLSAGATSFTYRRTFGADDVGSRYIDLVLQDLTTGVQIGSRSPAVGVTDVGE